MISNKKYSVKLFIFSSIFALVALWGIFLFLNTTSLANYQNQDTVNRNRYYLKEATDNSDPFITKLTQPEDVLAGPIISENDPALGDFEAPITLVYFSDFECSFCKEQELIFKKVLAEYRDKIMFVWKDYPTRNINSASFGASLAGRCAEEQGKFWEMHDGLFENNGNLDRQVFMSIASDLDLDLGKFETCFDEKKYKSQIKKNIAEANVLGITGIPFTYVNDQEIMGGVSEEELRRIIEIKLGNN